jgi:hypothetical protein
MRYLAILTLFFVTYNSFADDKPKFELKAQMAPWVGVTPEGKTSASKLYITNIPCRDSALIEEFKSEGVKNKIHTSIMVDERNHRFILGCYSHRLGKNTKSPGVDDVILLRWYDSSLEKTWELPADLFLQPGSFGSLPDILKSEPKLKAEDYV